MGNKCRVLTAWFIISCYLWLNVNGQTDSVTVATAAPVPTPTFSSNIFVDEDAGSASGEETTTSPTDVTTEGSGLIDETTTDEFEGSGTTTSLDTTTVYIVTTPIDNTTQDVSTVYSTTTTLPPITPIIPIEESVVQLEFILKSGVDTDTLQDDLEAELQLLYNSLDSSSSATRKRRATINDFNVTVTNLTVTTVNGEDFAIAFYFLTTPGGLQATATLAVNLLDSVNLTTALDQFTTAVTALSSQEATVGTENLVTMSIEQPCGNFNNINGQLIDILTIGLKEMFTRNPAKCDERTPGDVFITRMESANETKLELIFYIKDLRGLKSASTMVDRFMQYESSSVLQQYAASLLTFPISQFPQSIDNTTTIAATPVITTTPATTQATTVLTTTAGAVYLVPVWAYIVIGIFAFIILLLILIIIYLCCCWHKSVTTITGQEVPVPKSEQVPVPSIIPATVEPYKQARVEEPANIFSEKDPVKLTHVRKRVTSPPPAVEPMPSSSGVSEEGSTGDSMERDLFVRVPEKQPPFHQHRGRLTQEPRFQSTVHPITLPPIYSPKMSDRLHDSLTDDAIEERSSEHRKKRRSPRGFDEPTLRAYRAMQRPIDIVLDPPEPDVFHTKPRKRYHKRQGALNVADEGDMEMRLLTSPTSQPPGTYTTLQPTFHQDSPRNAEEIRNRMASLLEDAFSLIIPSTSNNLVAPQHAPITHVRPMESTPRIETTPIHRPPMPLADGRDLSPSRTPTDNRLSVEPQDPQVLFTKTHPRLVPDPDPRTKKQAMTSFTGPTSSGKPVYITPIRALPKASGNESVVWTPYRAFDEVSRLERDGEMPPPPDTSIPGRLNSSGDPPVNHPSPPHHPPPRSSFSDQPPLNVESTPPEVFVQSIKDEISRLVDSNRGHTSSNC